MNVWKIINDNGASDFLILQTFLHYAKTLNDFVYVPENLDVEKKPWQHERDLQVLPHFKNPLFFLIWSWSNC